MLYAIVRDKVIIEVCDFIPALREGESIMPMKEAIAQGFPYE
jgi:hypothetical protein